tara:strand:+ start:558 stop:854 length:297 start_codon:yes stop_codon:yes gene_type:complete
MIHTIKVRDIEKIEEQLYALVEQMEDLDNMRDTWVEDIVQNAGEQLREFGKHPAGYEDSLDTFEYFEEYLDEAMNHIKHALDIVTDKLPRCRDELANS